MTKTNSSDSLNIKNIKYLLFDLAGTLLDIPIENIWEEVNRKGMLNVLKWIQQQGFFNDLKQETLDNWIELFVEEKKRLRKIAKKELREYPLQLQISDFFTKHLEIKDIKFLTYLPSFLAELDEQFILPELEICTLIPEVKNVLRVLKEKYTLLVITNNVSRILAEKMLSQFDLTDFFESIFVSEDVEIRKPDQNFLKNLFTQYPDAKPRECLVIGDRLGQDIQLAKNCGMLSIHIDIITHLDNHGLTDIIQADWQVQSLKDLFPLLLEE